MTRGAAGRRAATSARRPAWWAPALSLALHAAALAAVLLLLDRAPPPSPGDAPAMAMVFDSAPEEVDSEAAPAAGGPVPPPSA
ncbi:hypothetical protein E2C05_31620, partial [Paracraurococcus ruber]